MAYISDSDNFSNRESLIKILQQLEIEFSFNHSPERYISKSLTQTKLKKYLDCPACFFQKSKKDTEKNNEVMLSNTIHYLSDYLVRNQPTFPNSRSVLDFINFSDGNFLEALKTDPENTNYDLLRYLSEIENPVEKERILKGVLVVYGTAKRLGFEEIRKNDAVSLNLKNSTNKSSLIMYTKPDYTGRHKTIYPKSGRKFDNFVIDYKLNFSENTKTNTIQMAFYCMTHVLSRRNIQNYFILDISSGNLFQMKKIDLNILFNIIDKFLILKNLNFRGKNQNHECEEIEHNYQQNFLDNLDIENFGNSFGSRTYNDLLLELKKLEESLEFIDLGEIVKKEELEKILSIYPIKIDSFSKD
jgi:hypothetical protein